MEQTTDSVVTIESIKDAMGEEAGEFLQVWELVNLIIDSPDSFSGKRAANEAARLAALRTVIGIKAQYYKTAERSIKNTKRKNVLMTMYQALEENINTLKLLSKMGAEFL